MSDLQRLRELAAETDDQPRERARLRRQVRPPALRQPAIRVDRPTQRPVSPMAPARWLTGPPKPTASVGVMTVHERPFGRYLEDFVVGDVYKHWPGKTITEYDDHLFCMITMNHHPLHTNDWFAERERAGPQRRGRQPRLLAGARHERARRERRGHRQPRGRDAAAQVPHVPRRHHPRRDPGARGARESKSKNDRGIVTVETKGFNQDGKEVCYFRRRVMVWKREFAPDRKRPYDGDRRSGTDRDDADGVRRSPTRCSRGASRGCATCPGGAPATRGRSSSAR